jgi:hypothetical protein
MDNVKPIRYLTSDIYNALMDVAELPQVKAGIMHKANCLADQMMGLKFVQCHNILFCVNITGKVMQITLNTLNCYCCHEEMNGILQFVQGCCVCIGDYRCE